jgi:hypothetical protein
MLRPNLSILVVFLGVVLLPGQATAWGDEGHEIIGLIAEQYLEPGRRAEVGAMLAADRDNLTAHDIASEATWADWYRDSDRNGSGERYRQTRQWHFVNIELGSPNLDQACHGHPPLPPGVAASRGPADACIVDKIDQFAAELASPSTDPEERLIALKFLLHLLGDVHQPLHTSDDHDAGGNRKQVAGDGFTGNNLHHLWDTEFVERVGRVPGETAAHLRAGISEEQRGLWARGTAADWAMESFALARDHADGMLPVGASGRCVCAPTGLHRRCHAGRGRAAQQGGRTACLCAQPRARRCA